MSSDCTHSPAGSPVIYMTAIVMGIALPLHALLPDAFAEPILIVALGLIAGAYIGFGAVDGRRHVFVFELCVAIVFAGMAVLGAVWSTYWFPAALFAHGLWDLLHHGGTIGARVPRWYIPFCVVVDWIAAALLFAILLVRNSGGGA